jgi:type III secretory pathway component EscS
MARSGGSVAQTPPVAKWAALLIVLAAVVGLGISLYGYLTPLTGITRSFGALLVCIASAALILDGLLLGLVRRRSAHIFWLVLGFLGAICTFAAAYFLHAWILMGAMAVVFFGLLICAASPTHRSSAEATA